MENVDRGFLMLNKKDSVFLLYLIIILVFFSLTSLYSFLLFHTLAELFSIVIAAAIFIIAWNSRDYIDNNYLLFIGIAFLFIGGIDFIHTLAYAGMNIFTGFDANLPTQLWIAGRYLQAATFVAAALLISRRINVYRELGVYLVIFCVLVISIFEGVFPDCFIEGQGLTQFKVVSEYIISLMLVVSIYLLYRRKQIFNPWIFNIIILSIFFTILSELAFTFYVSVYGFSNLVGHLFKIVAFALIYYALVESGIRRPYEIIFRNLSEKEKEVSKERDKLKMYLDIAGVLFIVLDTNGVVKRINPRGCEILGYEENEIVGKEFISNFIPEHLRNETQRLFSGIVTGETVHTLGVEWDILTKSGENRTLLWQYSIIRDEEGNITGLLGSGEDITARKEIEEAIKKNEEKYLQLFNNAGDAIFLHDLTEEGAPGRFLDINDMACEKLGYSREELLGMSVLDINTLSDKEKAPDIMRQLMKEGHVTFEGYHTRKDGFVFPVEVMAHLFTLGDKQVILSICRDITDRKKAEKVLEEERSRLENILEGTNAGTWEWNVQTGETVFNERWAEIIGYTLDELSPITIKTWEEHTHPDDLKRSGELLEKHFSGEIPYYNCEARMKHKDGHWVWVLDRGRVISQTEDGKPLMMFGTHIDITERKEAESVLQRTQFAFDHSPDEIYFVNHEGTIVYANISARKLFGIENDVEAAGKTVFDINPEMTPENWEEIWERASREEFVQFEGHHRKPDGTEYPVEINKYHITADGVEYSCTIARNITERKKAEEAIKEKTFFLNERVKELSALKSVSDLLLSSTPLNEIFMAVIDSVVSAMQYPEWADARIIFDSEEFRKKGFEASEWKISKKLLINEEERGTLEVFYRK